MVAEEGSIADIATGRLHMFHWMPHNYAHTGNTDWTGEGRLVTYQ